MSDTFDNDLQTKLLNKVKNVLPPSKSLVFELSELLKVSTDSVYRRMRGETSLTLEEVSKICNHFHVSLDVASENTTGVVAFNYSLLQDIDGFKTHWRYIVNDLLDIAKAKEQRIIYAAIDIPIFHYFKFPELAAFKMFYWMKEVMNVEFLNDKLFDSSMVNDEIKQIGFALYNEYCKATSVEIWTELTVNSLIKQIEFYWESGLFSNKQDALTICDQSLEMLNHVSKQAEANSKLLTANVSEDNLNYQFYSSDIELGNNCVHIVKDNVTEVYLGILTFNTMVTTNPAYCRETENWLNNIIKKSTLLSGSGQKQRYQFFKKVTDKIEDFRKKIETT